MQLATPLSHIGNIKADTVKYLLTVREPGQSGGALRRGYRSLVGSFSGLCCSKRQKSVGRCLMEGVQETEVWRTTGHDTQRNQLPTKIAMNKAVEIFVIG